MRGMAAHRWIVLVLGIAFFLLSGRLPDAFFSLEQVSAAAPVAVNDSYVAIMGVNLVISAPGLLANDTGGDGPLSVDLISVLELPPFVSSMSPAPDGSFQYLSSVAGTDTYTYKAFDGTSNSNTATITFHVDTRPVANNDSYSTLINTPLTIAAPQGVLANDADAENDPLTAVIVNPPANGLVTLNSDGSFTYTPVFGFGGSDSFTYTANDGITNSSPATVSIKVDRPPVASDDVYATPTNATLIVAAADGVLSNDSDVDGDALTATVVSTTTNGTLTLSPAGNGSFTYVPNPGYFGTDTFTYQANDGLSGSNIATVTIHVGDAPPVAANDAYLTKRNTQLTVAAPQGVLANDTDADINDTLTAVLVTSPASGSLALNANGSFSYTPPGNFEGTVSFAYRANDGTVNSNLATVTIQVGYPPVALDDSYGVNPNTTLHISAPGVLGNDVDGDGDTLTALLITQPAHGTLTLNTDGSFTYTPNSGYTGTDSFTYRSYDGAQSSNTATVNLTISSQPVATDDTYFAILNTQLPVSAPGILGNDTGSTLTVSLVTGVSHGTLTLNANGSFAYTPTPDFTGTDHFTYKANNGAFDSNVATVTIRVIGPSQPGAAPTRNFYTTSPVILTWNRVSNAIGYEIEVSTSSTFSTTSVVHVTTSPDRLYIDVSSLGNGTYFWRVRSQISATKQGSWTVGESFTVSR